MKGPNEQHLFSHVPSTNIPRSVFNRSHGHKTTFNAGVLIPVYVDEALPGDTIKLNVSAFARMTTPIFPLMDNLYLDFFFFSVPNRLLWTNWQKFMGEQANPGDSINYLVPQVTAPAGGWTSGSMGDYFGLPYLKDPCPANALPFRAYNLIWNEWFRDENLQNSALVPKTDGPDNAADYACRPRGKRHDYFTSCLPWPQKGTSPPLIVSGTAPVTITGSGSTAPTWKFGSAGTPESGLKAAGNVVGSAVQLASTVTSPALSTPVLWGTPALSGTADLSSATSNTINELRQAFQIQKLLERDARGGTRYTEILRSHFGVISPDARLQRPEFLGGGSVPVNINPVAQTSASGLTGGTTKMGSLSAFATVAARGIGFHKSFVEHCTLIGLAMVRADLNYQQGRHKMWSRRTRYDYYWPAFAHLGEQAVLNGEIYWQGNSNDDLVFGYQERYADYRYFPSKITGRFRSQHATPLDAWHLAQSFSSLPILGSVFIEENPPMSRVVAVTTEPHFYFDSLFTIHAARPMPTYSVPGFIDHF